MITAGNTKGRSPMCLANAALTGRSVAEPVTTPRDDVRLQGVPPDELRGEEGREGCTARRVQAITSHLDNESIAELEASNQDTPFSEESKMDHKSVNVEGFEVLQICPYCMRYSMKGVVYCDCCTCLIPSEQRPRNKERFDVSYTLPHFSKRNSWRVPMWKI